MAIDLSVYCLYPTELWPDFDPSFLNKLGLWTMILLLVTPTHFFIIIFFNNENHEPHLRNLREL